MLYVCGFSFDQLTGRKRPEVSARGCGVGVALRTRLLALSSQMHMVPNPNAEGGTTNGTGVKDDDCVSHGGPIFR